MRRYKVLIGILLAAVILLFGGIGGYQVWLRQQSSVYSYVESNRALDNPARGMYVPAHHTVQTEWLEQQVGSGHRLMLITMDLQNYTRTAIPREELDQLRTVLQFERENGVMVFFRASYKQNEEIQEPSLEQISEHIGQLAELLNEYRDIVLMVQAGMIGLWGEWHTSDYLRDEDAVKYEAGQVVSRWLETLDDNILLNLRRPSFIRLMDEAGINCSRIGFHDDGLLGSDSDLGTYADRQSELSWCAANINGRFNGGEMPSVSSFSEPENAAKEFRDLALSYLNNDYNTEVLDDWRGKTYAGKNAFDYIESHLGYRYYVSELVVPSYIFRGQDGFHFSLNLGNSGFSTIHRRFQLKLVIDDGNQKKYIPLVRKNSEKSVEEYEADIELKELAPVRIGLCYTDESMVNIVGDGLSAHYVEFANDESVYEDGVNYFLRYEWDGWLKNRVAVTTGT